MKQTSIIFLILTICLPLWAQSPKHEVRAVWLTTIGGIDWPHSFANSPQAVERQKQELCDILDRLKKRRHQHRAPSIAHTRHNHLSLEIRTVGRLLERKARSEPRIRCPSVRRRRVSSARNGNPCMGGDHSYWEMDRGWMHSTPKTALQPHPQDRARRIHEPRKPANCQLSGRHLRRNHPKLRHRRHTPRLHTLSRNVENKSLAHARATIHH